MSRQTPVGRGRTNDISTVTETNLKTEAASSAETAPALNDHKRILLVEGDGFTRLVLLLRLRLAGFNVDFTSNGILGLGKLRTCQPEILLLELKLCGLSGLELIKAAREEQSFGNRPIYVFTHADKMSRTARKELASLSVKVFDKRAITREDLVQIFATTFLDRPKPVGQPAAAPTAEIPDAALNEAVVSGAIEELVAGVREQSEQLSNETGDRAASGSELLSRVCSLASCATAAGVANLARQAKALENFLQQLGQSTEGYTSEALTTVNRAVAVMSSHIVSRERKPASFSAVFVDEAPASSRTLEQALLKAGFQPVCFGDPPRAVDYLADNPADLIIANVALPEAHGLALANIRQLPFHLQTPVIFGSDSTLVPAPGEELPGSAPRLDKAPLLLSELIVRALNEVHGTNSEETIATSPSPQPGRSLSSPAVDPGSEDGFALFAQVPRPAQSPEQDSSDPSAAVPKSILNRQQRFHEMFSDASIPVAPISRIEPAAPSADAEAESLTRLPAMSPDASQADEQPLEELPTSLQIEALQEAEPETIDQDGALSATDFVPTEGQNGLAMASDQFESDLEQNQAGGVDASAAANHGQMMNNQLQAAPTEYAQLLESSQPGEVRTSDRQDLATRVCEAEMALYHAKQDLEEKDQAIESLRKQLAEGQPGNGQNGQHAPGKVDGKSAEQRCAELEEEISALRQAFEGLGGNLGEPQASSNINQRVQELEQQLNERSAELEKAKQDQLGTQTELRQQLEAAQAASQQSEAARQEVQNRCAQLEQELSAARQNQKPAESDSAGKQTKTAGAGSELEEQVRQGVAALARATAELARERGERQRNQQLASDLNTRLQALHVDLSRTLQSQGEHLARITALEQQHDQSRQQLERSTAELEQQQAERRLAEEQLQKTKEANAQLRKDLSFFEDANNKFGGARQELHVQLEASLKAARETEARLQQESSQRQRLVDDLEEARRQLQNESRRREALDHELQATRAALQEREATLQKEAADRQRADKNHDALPGLPDNSERDLEFSKLQSALQLEQIERKRQESQLARTRQSALEAALAARALRTSLRRQVREPIDNLARSARTLLESEMGEQQKKLAEAVLQDVLLVQTRLREPVASHSDTTHLNRSTD